MALNNNDQTGIRAFLLGELTEDEQQTVEERLMVEDDLFDEFEISKSELVEEYCANELSRKENEWFESHFLASPEGRERYELAMSLGHVQRFPIRPRPLSFFERLRSLFNQRPSLIASATA